MVLIGLAQLCELLPDLRQAAASQGRSGEVEELITDSATGGNIAERLASLLRDLDGPELDERGGLPGLRPGKPTHERYACPYTPQCGRESERDPSGPIPECHRERHTPRNMRLEA